MNSSFIHMNPGLELGDKPALVERFENNVAAHPRKIAISDDTEELTYLQLDIAANKVRDDLKSLGVQQGDGVAIMLPHSCKLVACIIAVLKAGGYYIPVDLKNPNWRTSHILNDSNPKAKIGIYNGEIKASKLHDTEGNRPVRSDNHLAYVIYTSGTTGKPKGVGASHENVTHLLKCTESIFDFNQHDTWILCHSYAFDFSIWEIWGALWHGAKLVIPDDFTILDSISLDKKIRSSGVTVLNQTPTSFKNLQQYLTGQPSSQLRYLIFGGERLNPKLYKDSFRSLKDQNIVIVNMYGITETTVHASYHEICYQDLNSEKSNIGKLLPGFFYKILDDDGHQTREGELYLSGPQVTNGYIFDREKNVSRFIDLENEGGVYYKTGDIVREHENGELEYLGRNDDQVKIRGFRIELGEVESRLSSVSELSLTAVIRVDNEISGGDLACFYEVKPGHSISKRRLKLSARKILPPYMVPTYFIDVNSMPLSINGKIDKAKLVKQWRSK